MIEAITWWLTIEVIGAIAFPIAFLAFRFLPDRGYSFSKMLGLLLVSYLLWMGASVRVIPNQRWSIILILALLVVVSGLMAFRCRRDIASFLRQRWRHLLALDVLFVAIFASALFLRSYTAAFTLGGENMTDNAIINVTIRAEHFPPKDVWLSGHTINYHYFGHLNVAMLTTLTDIPSRITFNLSMALFTALAATGVLGVVYNLIIDKARLATALAFAMLAPLFLLVLSNIEGLFELLAAHGVGSTGFYDLLDIKGLDGPRESNAWYPTEPFWWGRAYAYDTGWPNRLFPFVQALVGGLHSEILAFPFIALVLGLALNLWRSAESTATRFLGVHPLDLALAALALGGLIMTNVWDGPTYLFVLVAVFALRAFLWGGRLNIRWLSRVVTFATGLSVLSVLFFLPFYLFTNFGAFEGIEFAAPPFTTAPQHFLYMWLPLLTLATVLAIAGMRDVRRFLPASLLVIVPILLVALPWAGNLLTHGGPSRLFDEIGDRGGNWIAIFATIGVLFLILMTLVHRLISSRDERRAPETVFALALGTVAVLLMLGVEFYWVRDPFWLPRFNTLNKITFQCWWLMSIAGAFGLYYFLCTLRLGGVLGWVGGSSLGVVTAIVLATGFIYPVLATFYFTDSFDGDRHLDGLVNMEDNEKEAVLWLLSEVDGTPTVLEAVGDQYTNFARVSSFTGLPTVLGWPQHEFWFRGASYEPQGARREDVARAYNTADTAEAQTILDRYDVEYVYVGRLEREEYSEAGLAKFPSFMDVVFQNDRVTIYRMAETLAQGVASGAGLSDD